MIHPVCQFPAAAHCVPFSLLHIVARLPTFIAVDRVCAIDVIRSLVAVLSADPAIADWKLGIARLRSTTKIAKLTMSSINVTPRSFLGA